MLAPAAVQRDPRYFSPDPEAFRPERWLATEKANFTLNPLAFFPFSYGELHLAASTRTASPVCPCALRIL